MRARLFSVSPVRLVVLTNNILASPGPCLLSDSQLHDLLFSRHHSVIIVLTPVPAMTAVLSSNMAFSDEA